MCRTKIFTAEEAAERQKKRYVEYIKNRYQNDPEFKELKKKETLARYRRKKQEEHLKKYGNLDNFKIRDYNKIVLKFYDNGDVSDNLIDIENKNI